MKLGDIITIDEVAKISRLSLSTIRKEIQFGKLKSLPRKGRRLFQIKEVKKWLGVNNGIC
jgi:excisionase family DNA binding protein